MNSGSSEKCRTTVQRHEWRCGAQRSDVAEKVFDHGPLYAIARAALTISYPSKRAPRAHPETFSATSRSACATRSANTRVCRVRTVENTLSRMDECKVGRTPWSAADAHVGLVLVFVDAWGSGSRGPRADQGVRPTRWSKVSSRWMGCKPMRYY